MESNTPHTFVYSYEEGVERVLNGSYAFLGESTMLDYLVQRNCNLTQIGGLLVCFLQLRAGVMYQQLTRFRVNSQFFAKEYEANTNQINIRSEFRILF